MFIRLFCLFISLFMFSTSFATEQNTKEKTVADIKIQFIKDLKREGYLSDKMAAEVAQKLITEKDKQINQSSVTTSNTVSQDNKTTEKSKTETEVKSSVTWSDYLSWINLFKVIGVILFLVAFSGIIKNIILLSWSFIVAVPVIVYQSVFLGLSLLGLIEPKLISESNYFYIALFSSFSTLIVLGWIFMTYKFLEDLIDKLFNWGIRPELLLSFYGMLYFGVLTFVYQSSIFGFATAVCLSGIFSFGMSYAPGVLSLDFRKEMLPVVVFGHLFVLIGYVFVFYFTPEKTKFFDIGIQYYCTIAMAVGLLVGSSPFNNKNSVVGYLALFIMIFIASTLGYFFYDLKVIGSIMSIFAVLIFLEWLGYLGYKAGVIIGSLLLGAALYGGSLLLEKYGSMIILTLN